MKNLRRVLSLALSGIMLVGMMAMSASAVNAEDFTDSDEITHTEAVSISTALKIIDGKDDGSFDPNGNVTRGQMAKMITRAMFGGEDPVLGLPTTPTFTDVPGSRWDATYIEYCANNEIINGRGDGTFDPEGNVTGTEAAKMLLTALGYKADIYGLVGPDWAITTNSIANQTDVALYGDLKGLDPTQPFTRDQVAQMIYNALNAETMEMLPDMSITNGTVTYKYQPSGKTLLYDRYGAVRVEGVVKVNEFSDNADSMKGKTTIALSNSDELKDMLGATPNANPSLKVASGKDVFERAVIVYVKPANNNKKDLSKGEVISDVIYDVDTNTEFTTTADKKLTDWPKDQGIKFDTFGEKDDQVATFYTNYADVTVKDPKDGKIDAYGEVDTSNGSTINDKNAIGTELIFIDNDGDGIINAVLQNVWEFGQVSKYSTKDDGSITVKTDGNKKLVPSNAELKEIVAYEDIKVDDYVNCTLVDETYYIEKAETVTGDLDSFENDGETGLSKSATVDGETYKTTGTSTAYVGGDLKSMTDIAKRSVLTEEVTIYLDAFGYAVAGATKAASDWLFVANAAVNNTAQTKNGGAMTAFVYFEDGTSGSYKVAKYIPAGSTTAEENFESGTDDVAIIGKLFQYSINSKGELVLEGATAAAGKTDNKANAGAQDEVTVADGTKGVIYDRDRSKLTIDVNGVGTADAAGQNNPVKYVTMDTAVFFVTLKADGSIDKVNVYDEKTAPSMSYETENGSGALWTKGSPSKFNKGVTYVATEKSSFDLDAVVFTNDTSLGSDWLFVINYVKSVDGGRVYNAIVDGELVQINTTDTWGYSRKENTAYSYAMDGDQYALDAASYSNDLVVVGEVSLIDRKSIIIKDNATGVEKKITNSTITALIDGGDTELDVKVSVGDVVCLIFNESKEAEAILILAEYNDTKSGVVYVADNVTDNGNKDYTVGIANALLGKAGALQAVKDSFAVAGKATVKVLGSSDTTATYADVKSATEKGDADVTDTATLKLVVISEDLVDSDDTTATTGYTVYTLTIADAG